MDRLSGLPCHTQPPIQAHGWLFYNLRGETTVATIAYYSLLYNWLKPNLTECPIVQVSSLLKSSEEDRISLRLPASFCRMTSLGSASRLLASGNCLIHVRQLHGRQMISCSIHTMQRERTWIQFPQSKMLVKPPTIQLTCGMSRFVSLEQNISHCSILLGLIS